MTYLMTIKMEPIAGCLKLSSDTEEVRTYSEELEEIILEQLECSLLEFYTRQADGDGMDGTANMDPDM